MTITKDWRLWTRITLKVIGGLLLIFLIAWLGLFWYIQTHKSEILKRVTTSLSMKMRGDLSIRAIEPSLFRGFPSISISLKDVSLRDSAWKRHRHSLIEASDVFIKLNPFDLVRHQLTIKKITLAHARIFLYTDSLGYSNSYLINEKDSSNHKTDASVNLIGLEDVHFWYINQRKHKLFHLFFQNMDAWLNKNTEDWHCRLKTHAHAFEFNFSTLRGSFVHDKDLDLDMRITYNPTSKELSIIDQKIFVEQVPVKVSGNFIFDGKPNRYHLHFQIGSIPYQTASSWMSTNIQNVVGRYSIEKPIHIDCVIDGLLENQENPRINVEFAVDRSNFHTPFSDFEQASFRGIYFNEYQAGPDHSDSNSAICIYGFQGNWKGIPLNSDTVQVVNLVHAMAKAHISSRFDIRTLNDLIGGKVMKFDQGTAIADLRYYGGIQPEDPSPYNLNGTIQILGAGLTYLPRNIPFSKVSGALLFSGDNLYLRNLQFNSRGNELSMEGDAIHFLHFYFNDPDKISLSWRLRSQAINLNDFISFVEKRNPVSNPTHPATGNRINRVSEQLDRVLQRASISIDAQVANMRFRNFVAQDVRANLSLGQSGIKLQEVQIRQGAGSLVLNGTIQQDAVNNPFQIKAVIKNVDVTNLFKSFDNFGQQALNSTNLKGIISADAQLFGNITDEGVLLKNSLKGSIGFTLRDGALNNFEPLLKIGRFVFKKRNLGAVDIKELHGNFNVDGNKIFILPMDIQTSVVSMHVQGAYVIGPGTDIYLEIPLRNPEKEAAATPLGLLLRKGKGFVVHIRAQDVDGTGVRIGWDPLKHGKRSTMDSLDKL